MKFALYIHNHQPTGNFDEVIEYTYDHAYFPLLKVLSDHPGIKFGIHNSGTLLEWLAKNHPEFIELLKHCVKTGQAEILSSAYGEPILTFIPKKDAIEQIRYFNDHLQNLFDIDIHGLWLTERIWEPGLISTLLDSGIEYTLLDDTHFKYAGLDEKDLSSYFVTEEEGRVLKVFPISMKLRYMIPFHPIDETIDFLKKEDSARPDCLKVLGDDGEKFGAWPGTFDWVYEKSWLNDFFDRLEKEKWISTVFLKDMAQTPAAGRVYFPTSSYEEMGEWVMPAERGKEYDELKRTVDKKYYYLIHGGYFKNFLTKYPEANLMQKRMLYTSRNIDDSIKSKLSLWRGQCSCAYWHGIFGGLYLPHLREAIYRSLLEAEEQKPPQMTEVCDFDSDGDKEIVYSDQKYFFVIRPKTASFLEIDDRKSKLNILNYLGRRIEKYHYRIPTETSAQGVRSIHENALSKEKDLHEYLVYDRYPRSFSLDRALAQMPTIEDFYRGDNIGEIIEYRDFVLDKKNRFRLSARGRLDKCIEIKGGRDGELHISYRGKIGLFATEFSLGIFRNKLMLNHEYPLTQKHEITDLTEIVITADDLRPIGIRSNKTFTLFSYPIETVSSSEAGFERNLQGTALLMVFEQLPELSIAI
jgi:hypothetical protein